MLSAMHSTCPKENVRIKLGLERRTPATAPRFWLSQRHLPLRAPAAERAPTTPTASTTAIKEANTITPSRELQNPAFAEAVLEAIKTGQGACGWRGPAHGSEGPATKAHGSAGS